MAKKRLHSLVDQLDLAQTARFVLASAQYHFHMMVIAFDQAKEGSMDTPDFSKHIHEFFYHFRSFLWEQVASFDTLLQAINQRLELGINSDEVKWPRVKSELNLRANCSALENRLNGEYSSQWYRDVSEFRNFAHVGALPAEGVSIASDPPGGPKGAVRFAALRVPIMGDPVNECREYGKKMKRLVLWALEELERLSPPATK